MGLTQSEVLSSELKSVDKRLAVGGLLTVEELSNAEKEIIKFCQRKRFPDELSCLQNGRSVKRNSHIFRISPVIEDGILRVGGRLSRAALPENMKHPVILAKICTSQTSS